MSQAQGGTYFLATNQIANTGAIAMNGLLELEGNLGISEPQFFSVSIDHAMACINVHWPSEKAESGTIYFHVENLLQYFLDVDGLKAGKRAVKNILDYGVSGCNRRTHGRGRKKMPTHW